MGLYLALFAGDDEDDELDGVEIGGYDDFDAFRSAVQAHLEPSGWGSRFPTLMNHPDAAGVWTPADAARLERDLVEIRDAFLGLPASPATDGWQQGVAASRGLRPASLHESFYDIDGEPLLDRLIGLARLSQDRSQPIWFQ